MFKAVTSLGIDISQGRINLALLKSTRAGVKLLKSAGGAIPEGVIENGDIEKPTELAKAIKRIVSKNRMRAQHANITLFVNPTLIQILDLPPGAVGNLRKIVQEEVKHYAVLPMQHVATDYCGIKASAKSDNRRAFVVSTDNKKLTAFAEALSREGLNVDAIEPASVAYIRANYNSRIAKNFDKNLLFAIAHEKILSIYLFRNENLEFVGTKAVEDIQLDSDSYFEWMSDEIYAVIQYYELEVLNKQDNWEVNILLPSCENYSREKMGSLAKNIDGIEINVKSFEDAYLNTPFSEVKGNMKPSVIALGLGMKSLDLVHNSLNINLFPSEIAASRQLQRQFFLLAKMAAMFLVLLIIGAEFLNTSIAKTTTQVDTRRQIRANQNTQDVFEKFLSLEKEAEELNAILENINKVKGSNSYLKFSDILNDIADSVPQAVRISSLSMNSDSKIRLEGSAISYKDIQLFVDKLNEIEEVQSAILLSTEYERNSEDFMDYMISCSLVK